MNVSPTAQVLLNAYDQVRQIDPAALPADLSLEDAANIQREIISVREGRGEKPVGYKIGFTNRTIWDRYGVHHPIWGPVYDTTLTLLDSNDAGVLDISRFTEPRLEPEIVIKLRQSPLDANLISVARAIDWVAHGFEIVQSAYPGWQFSGAQSFAAQALHGALLVGPRHPATMIGSPESLPSRLSGLSLSLYRDDETTAVDQGSGINVLDGPLHALAHLVAALLERGETLRPDAIITTGTLTDAQPLLAGQRWRSELADAGPIEGLSLMIAG
mgnify:CR=1 FL=1